VILVSSDASLLALFERAVSEHDKPVVAATEDELRAALASKAETVVIDAPPAERLEAWHRVRRLHAGMVLVVVDHQSETKDWPSDVARRFLVRPLVEDEIVTALAVRPKILREPAAARRRRLAQARRPPVVPPPIAAPEPPSAGAEPVRRLSTEENLWSETHPEPPAPGTPAPPAPPTALGLPAPPAAPPAAAPAPGPPAASETPAPPSPPTSSAPPRPTPEPRSAPDPKGVPIEGTEAAGIAPAGGPDPLVAENAAPAPAAPAVGPPPRRTPAADRTTAAGDRMPSPPPYRRLGLVAAGIVLLLLLTTAGGIAIGRATANTEPSAANAPAASPSSTPGTSTPPTTAPPRVVFKTPAACDAALSDADAALSYLVGNVRDKRLNKSMQSYQQNRKACRAAAR
jgi:hypothetical protein